MNFPDKLGNKWKDAGRRALGGGVEVAVIVRPRGSKLSHLLQKAAGDRDFSRAVPIPTSIHSLGKQNDNEHIT